MYPNPTYPHPLHRVCSWCKHWACRKGAESDASVLLKDRFPCSHKPGYLPGMLFVGRGRAAGQWGMQKWKKQTPRLLQGHLDDRREFYMDWRPSTASSGTCRLPDHPSGLPINTALHLFYKFGMKSTLCLLFSASVEQQKGEQRWTLLPRC